MSDHRWQGYTHRELFEQINEGPGAEASLSPARRWTELTRALSEIDSGLASALSGTLAGWSGEAADSARNGIRPLGDWAVEAQAAAEAMRQRAEQQAEFVSKARTDMPPPVAVTSEDPGTAVSLLTHLFGGQTDYEVQEAQQDAAEQRAFEVMRTYDSSTHANTTSLASFTPPPQIVVDSPAVGGGAGARGHHHPVTITWGGPPTPGSGAGSASGRSGGARAERAARTAESRGSAARAADSGPPGRWGAGQRRRDEAEPVDRSVTEELGEPGAFFDEHRTLSRPVIGGDAH